MNIRPSCLHCARHPSFCECRPRTLSVEALGLRLDMARGCRNDLMRVLRLLTAPSFTAKQLQDARDTLAAWEAAELFERDEANEVAEQAEREQYRRFTEE